MVLSIIGLEGEPSCIDLLSITQLVSAEIEQQIRIKLSTVASHRKYFSESERPYCFGTGTAGIGKMMDLKVADERCFNVIFLGKVSKRVFLTGA